MSPVLHVPKPQHQCLEEHRFDPDINHSDLPIGMIWECPDCRQRYIRSHGHYDHWSKVSRWVSNRIIRKAKRRR